MDTNTVNDVAVETVNSVVDKVVSPKKRGFAAMDPERVKEFASRGGKAVHAKGTAHRWTSEEAKIFGSLGGKAPRRNRTQEKII